MVRNLTLGVDFVSCRRVGIEFVSHPVSSRKVGTKDQYQTTASWVSCCLGMRILIYFRYTAIMRGAVFHRLGFNFVTKRVLRRSYGLTIMRMPFNPKTDPPHLRAMHPCGLPACRGVMEWYAVKVSPTILGTCLQ